MRRIDCAKWWMATAVAFSGTAPGQNALVNADFDSSAAYWQSVGSSGSAVYNAASGSPAVGSVYLTVNDPSNNTLTYQIEQCVAVAPNVSYTFAGRALIDAAGSTSPNSAMFVIGWFYSSYNCSGAHISSSEDIANVGGTAPGTPLPFVTYSRTVISPATARSFKFIADVQSGGVGAGSGKGWVDHASLTSPEALFINGFDVPLP